MSPCLQLSCHHRLTTLLRLKTSKSFQLGQLLDFQSSYFHVLLYFLWHMDMGNRGPFQGNCIDKSIPAYRQHDNVIKIVKKVVIKVFSWWFLFFFFFNCYSIMVVLISGTFFYLSVRESPHLITQVGDYMCLCVQISPFHKDTSHIGLELTLLNSV